jgi:hypothetical protein
VVCILDHPQAISLNTSHVTEISRNNQELEQHENKRPHDKKYMANSKKKEKKKTQSQLHSQEGMKKCT